MGKGEVIVRPQPLWAPCTFPVFPVRALHILGMFGESRGQHANADTVETGVWSQGQHMGAPLPHTIRSSHPPKPITKRMNGKK